MTRDGSKTGVPEEIQFQTKPRIALDQIRHAVEQDIPRGVVLADAASMAWTVSSAPACRNCNWNMQWAFSLRRASGNSGHTPLPAKPSAKDGAAAANCCGRG